MTLEEFLIDYRKRPGMYTGAPSITLMEIFIAGWEFGDRNLEGTQLFGEFGVWVAKRKNIRSSHGWKDIILFYSMDERHALDQFFRYFSKFLVETGRVDFLKE